MPFAPTLTTPTAASVQAVVYDSANTQLVIAYGSAYRVISVADPKLIGFGRTVETALDPNLSFFFFYRALALDDRDSSRGFVYTLRQLAPFRENGTLMVRRLPIIRIWTNEILNLCLAHGCLVVALRKLRAFRSGRFCPRELLKQLDI